MFEKQCRQGIAGIVLLLVTLACGAEVTATKIGEVDSNTSPLPSESTTLPQNQELSTQAFESAQDLSATESHQEIATSQGPITYQIGDIVTIGDLVVVVLGWDSPTGDEFIKPKEGKKFVAVDVVVVNQGEEITGISSLVQSTLADETGQRYNIDFMASTASGKSSLDGELVSGERLRGTIGFQVSESATGLVYMLDPEMFDFGRAFIELGTEPVKIDPPVNLPGEKELETFAVGDVIQVGDFTLSVNEVSYPSGNEFMKPETGNKFLVVDVTFQNNGTESTGLSSLMQMYLKDETGQKYDIDISSSVASGGTTPDGEIAPGEKLRGQVGFQVPENLQNFLFVFDVDLVDRGKVFVSIR